MGQSSSIEPVLGKENIHYCGTLLPLACCTHKGFLHARMITLGMMEAAARGRQLRQQSKHYPDLRQIGIKAW